MAASSTLPQSSECRKFVAAAPKHGVITLSGYGISVTVNRGHLCLMEGPTGMSPAGGFRLPRVGHGLRRLIVIGSDGMVSLSALRWLADQDASFALLERDGRVLATTGPVRPSDAKLRRAQALAAQSETGLQIARELISRKLVGQEQIARAKLRDSSTADSIAGFRAALAAATSLGDIRFLESQGAAAYWAAWRDLPIMFPKTDLPRVPDHWRVFGTRKSPLSGSPRLAANPPNSMLNFLYSLLESEARLALTALGLDPGLGVIHVDTTARDSFACDLMEAVRPSCVDGYVLDWILSQPLRRDWFFEQRDGNCRLMASFAIRLSQTTGAWGRAIAPVAEWVAHQLWSTTRKRTHRDLPPARLTQSHKREAKVSLYDKALRAPLLDNLCRGCGKPVSSKDHAECWNCAQSGARARMLNAGITGRVASRSPEARAKHRASRRRHADACSAWDPASQPAWLTLEVYSKRIQPLLPNVRTCDIRSRLRVSWWYASKIRQGYRPHPRHWQALAQLAGVSQDFRVFGESK